MEENQNKEKQESIELDDERGEISRNANFKQ